MPENENPLPLKVRKEGLGYDPPMGGLCPFGTEGSTMGKKKKDGPKFYEKEKDVIQWLYDNHVIKSLTPSKNDIVVIYKADLHGRTNSYSTTINHLYRQITKRNLKVSNKTLFYRIHPVALTKKNGVKKKKSKNATRKAKKPGFYSSPEWRELRIQALVKYGRKCCLCGRTVKDGVVLHVDHIKPRSLRPNLALDIDNLQILCEDCNLGKSNHYSEDWR